MTPRAVTALAACAIAVCAPAPSYAAGLASVRIGGAASGDLAGTSVAAAGDVNGDGAEDVIVGAPNAAPGGRQAAGAGYVVLGPFVAGTTIDLGALAGHGFMIAGARPGELAGQSVATAGDVNADGLADVIVGAPGALPQQETPMQFPGRAYVVFGRRALQDVDLAALGSRGLTLTGESHRFPDAFGWSVAGVGDVDGDGLADVAIAAPGNPGFEEEYTRGRAYVVFGRRAGGAVSPTSGGFRIGFGVPGQMTAVAAAGDWNRDGHADVAVADGHGLRNAGAVWVVYGRRRHGTVSLARLGRDGLAIRGRTGVHYELENGGLAGGRDIDGDRRPDLVVGAPRAHGGTLRSAGAIWAVHGSASRTRVELSRPGAHAWELARGAHDSGAGTALALADVDGDRLADTVVSAGGSLYVAFGTRAHRTATLGALPGDRGFVVDGHVEPLPDPALGSPGAGGFTTVGAAPDLNGDGHAELLAGARWAGYAGRARAGAALVLFAP